MNNGEIEIHNSIFRNALLNFDGILYFVFPVATCPFMQAHASADRPKLYFSEVVIS